MNRQLTLQDIGTLRHVATELGGHQHLQVRLCRRSALAPRSESVG